MLGFDEALIRALGGDDAEPDHEVPFVLAGEVDLANASDLAQAIGAHAALGTGDVVVDASGLTYIDSRGLAALVVARRRLVDQGREIVLTGVSPKVRRVFAITGLEDLLLDDADAA